MTSALLSSAFWERLVLPLANTEPAIRHGILALSSLHQRFELLTEPEPDKAHEASQFALVQYDKALSYARQLIASAGDARDDVIKVMVTCVLSICYENLQGHYAAERVHRQNGLRILKQHRKKQRSRSSAPLSLATKSLEFGVDSDIDCIASFLSRLDFQAMTFSDSRTPYESSPEDLEAISTDPPLPPPPVFADLWAASHYLIEHIRWYFRMAEAFAAEKLTFETLDMNLEFCKQNLLAWRATVDEMNNTAATFTCASLLKLYYLIVNIIMSAGFYGAETRWDSQYKSFAEVIEITEALLKAERESEDQERRRQQPHHSPKQPRVAFSLELGIVIPLFITSAKCRDPHLRRRAIALMRETHRQEGAWNSYGAANVQEQIMKWEEDWPVSAVSTPAAPPPSRVDSEGPMRSRSVTPFETARTVVAHNIYSHTLNVFESHRFKDPTCVNQSQAYMNDILDPAVFESDVTTSLVPPSPTSQDGDGFFGEWAMPKTMKDVPDERRVRDTIVTVYSERKCIHLHCTFQPWGVDGPWEMREADIYY